MKRALILSLAAMLYMTASLVAAQDRDDEIYGMPGDNLNLYAVMKLFRESPTLESFEQKLNNENSAVNNLDLNGNRLVDYITVNDYVQGDVHTIVLRVALSETESQDVAVFTVQRFSDGSAQVQLIGDEALYGPNYIVEPNYGDYYGETVNPGYSGNQTYRSDYQGAYHYEYDSPVQNGLQVVSDVVSGVVTTALEVAAWPLVTFLFRPAYIAWRSLWGWNNYPVYWNSWQPWGRYDYYSYHDRWYPQYYREFRHWDHLRCSGYNDFYYRDIRSHSPRFTAGIDNGSRRMYGARSLHEAGMRSDASAYRRNEGSSTRSYAGQSRQGSNSMGSVRSSATGIRSGRSDSYSRNNLTASGRPVSSSAGRRVGITSNSLKSGATGNVATSTLNSSRNIRYSSSANRSTNSRMNNSSSRPAVGSSAGRIGGKPTYTLPSATSRRQVAPVSGGRTSNRAQGSLKSSSGRSASAFSGRTIAAPSNREKAVSRRSSSSNLSAMSTSPRSSGHNSAISGRSSGNRGSQQAFSGRGSSSRGSASSGGSHSRSTGHGGSSRR